MTSCAIFLRGVTPTGRNRVPMAALRAALAGAGLRDVRTYIQSGNAVAATSLTRAALERLVREVIAREIGADVAVMARTRPELARVMAGNPFPLAAASRTYFSLLAETPAAPLVAALRAQDFAPDAVEVAGDTLYTLYATKLSDSQFTNNFFERKLKVAATTRNFNTMSRLLELCA
jgi:uncharacterized protein (DUF1697 family)